MNITEKMLCAQYVFKGKVCFTEVQISFKHLPAPELSSQKSFIGIRDQSHHPKHNWGLALPWSSTCPLLQHYSTFSSRAIIYLRDFLLPSLPWPFIFSSHPLFHWSHRWWKPSCHMKCLCHTDINLVRGNYKLGLQFFMALQDEEDFFLNKLLQWNN